MSNAILDFLGHLVNAGQFNEGRPGAVSGDDLPADVKRRVDALAAQRDTLSQLDGAEEEVAQLQKAINYLYNPRTRSAAMASWQQLHGDETNQWSATGGRLHTAAGMANSMTEDPERYQYGGRRSGQPIPRGARVAPAPRY